MKRPCSVFVIVASMLWGVAISAETAWGTILVQAESKVITSGPAPVNSFFDVFFSVTGSNPDLAGYDVRVDLSPIGSGVTFGTPIKTDSLAPVRTSVFLGTNSINGGSTASTIRFSDSVSSGAETINNLEGLVRVPFTVAANASGTFNLTINLAETLLGDINGSPINFQATNGQLQISPVPEPWTGSMAIVASFVLFAYLSRYRAGLWMRAA